MSIKELLTIFGIALFVSNEMFIKEKPFSFGHFPEHRRAILSIINGRYPDVSV